MAMSLDFSVVVPTFNGAERLAYLLEKLRSQVNTESITWEIIIVDNNSTDATADVVQSYQVTWQHPFPLKYYFEPEQGAAFARLQGVRQAQGHLVGFLDDDNLPALDWLSEAYQFGKVYPAAGAYSGQIHGEFEIEPPQNFKQIQAFLAIREHGIHPRRFDPKNLQLPPAASLIVRREVWCQHVPERPFLTGKLPGLFVQGDDYEPLLYIYKAGWEIWYCPTLHTYHQIPWQRLEKAYLLTLAKGCGLATYSLLMITAHPWEKPLIFGRTIAGSIHRMLKHFIQYRQNLNINLAASCEMAFYQGCLMSPFFYWQRHIKS